MAVADRAGFPLAIYTDSASPHEVKLVGETLAKVFTRQLPDKLIGDKAYDSDPLDAELAEKGVEMIAPHKRNRKKAKTQDGRKLRRYKRRIRNHHSNRSGPVEFGGASSYILAATEDADEVEPDTLTPVVIAEMETKIPSITVGEAVMQMELAGQKMLVFRNEGHGGVNVVYRRDDGNIGWIDPRNSK